MAERLPAENKPAARPGRPRQLSDEQRRRQLIDAAEHVFLERGYHAATIAHIAERAGMSKKTIYQVFPGKAALFEALLSDRLAVFTLPIEADDREPAAALESILLKVALFALSPKQIRLLRLLIAEASRSPEMARVFHRQGLGRGAGTLEKWFAAQAERGTLPIKDPVRAANMIFNLAIGDLNLFMLLKSGRPPTRVEIGRRVREAVAFFMRGLAETGD